MHAAEFTTSSDTAPADQGGSRRLPGIVYATEETPGLTRYPDALPLPARIEDVPEGFFLSAYQVAAVLGQGDRHSEFQERKFAEFRIQERDWKEAQHKAALAKRREEKKARQLWLWRRDYERQLLRRARPDWFKPGLNTHNLALAQQKTALIRRCAGYLAELVGPGGYADLPGRFSDAVAAVYATRCPYKSPRKARELRDRVLELARVFVEARTRAKEDAEKAAEISSSGEGSPPPPHARVPVLPKGEYNKRTPSRAGEFEGYSDRPLPPKPLEEGPPRRAGGLPTRLGAPQISGTPAGLRNIVWLAARHLPHPVVGLAFANLHRLESSHGRYGCRVPWSRGHALNWLASSLAAGRPLRDLLGVYRDAVRREDERGIPTVQRAVVRARRAAYRLGIVQEYQISEYFERRDKECARRAVERDWLRRQKAEAEAQAALGPLAGEIVIPWRAGALDAPRPVRLSGLSEWQRDLGNA